MILFLIFLAATIFIGAITFRFIGKGPSYGHTKMHAGHWLAYSLVPMYVWIMTATIIVGTSYDSYLEVRAFHDAIVEQYRDAIDMYSEKAIAIDARKAFALTDFGYAGYQQAMAEFIKDLRHQVSLYNETFIKKQQLVKNPFFNWYIIEPDPDMKLLRLRLEKQEAK